MFNKSDFCILCVVEKCNSDYVKDWYNENSDFDHKIVFIYENESTYLNEYENFKKSHIDLFNRVEVIQTPYFMRVHIENVSQIKKVLHFDQFYDYIKRIMEENKYAYAIDQINRYIYYLDPVHTLEKAILYTKLAKCMQTCQYNESTIVTTYEKAFEADKRYLVPLYELIVKHRLAGLFEKGVEYMELLWREVNLYGTVPQLFNDSNMYDEFIENVVKKNKYLVESLYTYLYFLEFEAIICYIHSAESLNNNSYFEIAYQLCNRVMMRKMMIADESIKQINHFKARCIDT